MLLEGKNDWLTLAAVIEYQLSSVNLINALWKVTQLSFHCLMKYSLLSMKCNSPHIKST